MAKITEVRNILKNINAKVGRKKNGIFPIVYQNSRFALNESDVDNYIKLKSKALKQTETSIHFKDYLEHVVEFQPNRFILVRSRFRNKPLIVKNKDNSEILELSSISPLFALFLLDKTELPPMLKRYFSDNFIRNFFGGKQTPNFIDILSRIMTIKLTVSKSSANKDNIKYMLNIINSGLFNIAYTNGIGITLSSSWGGTIFRLGKRRSKLTQYPMRLYNTELSAYYHLAMGSDSMILAYLALYNILEFFFTSSSEKALHAKVKEKLILPDFSHAKSKKLRELITVIRKYDQKTNEYKMLENVLKEYFPRDELVAWIENYEKENGNYLTIENNLFSEKFQIDFNESKLFSSIAARIYHIRNALVHSKEGKVSRYIPFSGQEHILSKEIPLLMYISEMLIIKSGKEISS